MDYAFVIELCFEVAQTQDGVVVHHIAVVCTVGFGFCQECQLCVHWRLSILFPHVFYFHKEQKCVFFQCA